MSNQHAATHTYTRTQPTRYIRHTSFKLRQIQWILWAQTLNICTFCVCILSFNCVPIKTSFSNVYLTVLHCAQRFRGINRFLYDTHNSLTLSLPNKNYCYVLNYFRFFFINLFAVICEECSCLPCVCVYKNRINMFVYK